MDYWLYTVFIVPHNSEMMNIMRIELKFSASLGEYEKDNSIISSLDVTFPASGAWNDSMG